MKLTKTTGRMMFVICMAALVMIAGGLIVCLAVPARTFLEAVFFAIGVTLTSLLNIWKVLLLERTVKKTLDMDNPDTGRNYVRFQYLLRYFLTGAVLLAAGLIGYFTPHISIVLGAVFGVFTMQISVIIARHMKPGDE